MTIKSQLERTVALAEDFHGDLISYANQVQDKDVQEMFRGMAKQVEEMMPHLRGRLHHIQDEEPQYR